MYIALNQGKDLAPKITALYMNKFFYYMSAKAVLLPVAAGIAGKAATARLFAKNGHGFVGLFDIDQVGLAKLQQELGYRSQ